MNAAAFRHFYEYHFAQNRKIWDRHILSLTQEQYTQPVAYSVGSVRDQLLHIMHVDKIWFNGLRGVEIPDWPDSADFEDRNVLRAEWDAVEQMMREYLANLSDERLLETPLEGEDENLIVWQVLLHVVNHGTDHRAQVLRVLNDLGANTEWQDYIFYTYGHPSD